MQGCSPAIKNTDSQGSSIVCFGDSITYGQGAGKGEDYPSVLRNLSGVRVVNAGVPGDTTADALRRINSDVLSKDPYLVIVEFGANDYFKQLPEEETIANMREIIQKLQAYGAMVAVMDVSGQWSGVGLYDIHHGSLKKLAREEGCLFIPRIMSNIANNPSLRTDNFHPTTEGYKIVGERAYEAVRPYIKSGYY